MSVRRTVLGRGKFFRCARCNKLVSYRGERYETDDAPGKGYCSAKCAIRDTILAGLVTCPHCGRSGFTPRGLAAHRGSGHCQRTQAENTPAQPTAGPVG